MAVNTAEKIDRRDAPDESPARAVHHAIALKGQRLGVETLLGDIHKRGVHGKALQQKYQQAVDADKTKGNAQGAEGLHQWVREAWSQAEPALQALTRELDKAVLEKNMSKEDRDFLLARMVGTDEHDFLLHSREVADTVHKKIERAVRDKKDYLAILNHPLVGDDLKLKTGDNRFVPIPDEEAFMKLNAKERRAKVDEWKKALTMAKGDTELSESREAKELHDAYTGKLNAARRQGIIGKKTAEEFMSGRRDSFENQKLEKQREYVAQFDTQMEIYRLLWKDIEETLPPEEVTAMRAQIDTKGKTKLTEEFSERMEKVYGGKLGEMLQARVISRHTHDAFAADMKKQETGEKKRYLQEFDNEMAQYRELRAGIDTLRTADPKAYRAVDALYDSASAGYTEISQAYAEHADGAEDGAAEGKMQSLLSSVKRDRVRHQIEKSDELLKDEGEARQTRFLRHLDEVARTEERSRYDETDYQQSAKNLREERRQKLAEKEERTQAAEPADRGADVISLSDRVRQARQKKAPEAPEPSATATRGFAEADAEASGMEARDEQGVHVTRKLDDAFHKTEVNVGPQTKKAVEFRVGKKEAVQSLLQEDISVEGRRDAVHFMAEEDGQIDRMTLEDVRVFRDVLRLRMSQKTPDKKAA